MQTKIVEWGSRQIFNTVHRNKLVYNACWEDPRLDREAMNLGPNDTILMITSAGCNVLDYLLDRPKHIYTVDLNPRQNALLELKLAAIRALAYEDFFKIFGKGHHEDFKNIYFNLLRPQLNHPYQQIWDRNAHCFDGTGRVNSFYYYGASGAFANAVGWYINRANLRPTLDWIFSVDDVAKQFEIYHRYLKQKFWSPAVRWAVQWDAPLALLGVPRAQRKQVEDTYSGGIAKFMEDCVESVFTAIPLTDNYFWWLYFNGSYSPDRCPEYLKEENFNRLKDEELANRVSSYTGSVIEWLDQVPEKISRFVLLDHMDWLCGSLKHLLNLEWQGIVNAASENARILWRSGGRHVDFVDPIEVLIDGTKALVGEVLNYNTALAESLHARDRVHTYGSFYIADVKL